jgi:hypothetical protein
MLNVLLILILTNSVFIQPLNAIRVLNLEIFVGVAQIIATIT